MSDWYSRDEARELKDNLEEAISDSWSCGESVRFTVSRTVVTLRSEYEGEDDE